MKIFILDDDENILDILEMIIEDKELGNIIGKETDGEKGLNKIKILSPDIVLIDLLMSGKDGLSIVKEVKKDNPQMQFIMISQVSTKKMVERAYRYGVEYFINKPINAVEVEIIIKKVIERLEIDRAIQSMWKKLDPTASPVKNEEEQMDLIEDAVNDIFKELGILGESGTDDILQIVKYSIKNNINLRNVTMREFLTKFVENPRTMEQRIRRAINMAMINIVNLGLEDNLNDAYLEYSNSLFDFEQVRKEMEYIRGNLDKGGSSNIKKFLISLISYCE